ncbi:MAG: class I SAM-dependent DNA methyltransferase [Terriglobales bacterium]
MCASPIHQHRAAYDPFAAIYNRSMAEDFCRRALPVVHSLLLHRLPDRARIFDLCCGSGQMARTLSEKGFLVTGIDSSAEMLRLARQNAPGVPLILSDARCFALAPVFDAAVSTFNSLAHITGDDLRRVFRNVRASLNALGTFLFDLTMEDGYAAKWRGSFSEVHENVAWTVRPSYDSRAKLARNDVTIFRRQSGNIWQRSDFRIAQNCHSEYELRNHLNDAGFRRIDTYDAERDLGMDGEFGRRFFVAA